ncbi:single-stranded DNA-binding protein 2 [Spirochaetia bacterium]|nr:single-stranded DNA-binding protein 2 [Spirochaetia bacterium]
MNNLNSILIEGNLVREPLFRSTPKGTPICTFSLASNRYLKKDSGYEQEVSFFEVETWAKIAESCRSLGHKGRGVRVVGRLKQDRWPGPDGKNHARIMIVAEHVEFRPEFKKDDPAYTGKTGAVAKEAAGAADDDEDTYADLAESTEMAVELDAQLVGAEKFEEVAF